MNLRQIEAFVKIANNGSFSKTAKELYLTQPTVSAYVNSLETELGVKLFNRTTKEVSLTEQGSSVYLFAREILEATSQIYDICGKKKNIKNNREILISASTIPAQYLLPGILADYSQIYPDVRFNVSESDSENVVRDIENHKADIGFTGTMLSRKNCRYIPFYKDELVVIAPNKDRFRIMKERSKDLGWIRHEALILRESGSGTRQEAMKALEKLGIRTDSLNIVGSFANTEAILRSVISGMGCAVVSKLAAQSCIDREELLAFPISPGGAYRDIYMVLNSVHPVAENTEQLMAIARESYGLRERREA